MNEYYSSHFGGFGGMMDGGNFSGVFHWAPAVAVFSVVMVLITVWSLVWKILALWRAARQGSKWWFIILAVVNTLGILEILYLFVFSKKKGIKEMMKPAKAISADINDQEKNAEVI